MIQLYIFFLHCKDLYFHFQFFFLQEINFFFDGQIFGGKNTATFSDCTLCIIKPHAIIEGIVY